MRLAGIIVFLVGMAWPVAAIAQDATRPVATLFFDPVNGISLEEAVARALSNEPGLRAARTTVDAARGQLRQAALRPNPGLLASHQTEPGGTDNQTRVELQWPLDLFRKPGRVGVAQRELEATELRVQDRERLLAAEVRIAYGRAAAELRAVTILDDVVASASRQQQLIGARVNEGAAPPIERDMMAVEVQRLTAERLLGSGRLAMAMIELKRILGLLPSAQLTLRSTVEELVLAERGVVPAKNAIDERPDVRETVTRVTLADARIGRATQEGRFDASVFGMYMRMDAGFPQRGFGANLELERVRGQFHYLGAGVMLSLPLRDQRQGDVAAARAERAGAEAARDATTLGAQAELASAQARDEHAMRALDVWSTDARNLARQNLQVMTQTYELGRLTLPDVLNERRRYLEFERAYTAALGEAYEARQTLRRAAGERQ